MKVQVSLIRHMDKVFELLGCRAPEVVLSEGWPDKNFCAIKIDVSKVNARPLISDREDQYIISCQDTESLAAAEHKACISVKKLLEEKFAVEIEDCSIYKMRDLEVKIDVMVGSLKIYTQRLQSYLKEYQSAISLVSPLVVSYSQNSNAIVKSASESLSALENGSKSVIGQMQEETMRLDHEMVVYCAHGYGYKSSSSIEPRPVVCTLSFVDFLADILAFLQLPPAKYITCETGSNLFTSRCNILLDGFHVNNTSGGSSISGEPKSTPFDAESSAAANAISFLEVNRNLEIVDFNFDSLLQLRQRHEKLENLCGQYKHLMKSVSSAWSAFGRSLMAFIDQQYGKSEELFLSDDKSSSYHDLRSLARAVELTQYDMWNMQGNAMSEISKLVD